jgi:hypothetical protein
MKRNVMSFAAVAACAAGMATMTQAQVTTQQQHQQHQMQQQQHQMHQQGGIIREERMMFDPRMMDQWTVEERFDFMARNLRPSDQWALSNLMQRLPANHAAMIRNGIIHAGMEGMQVAHQRRMEMMRTAPGAVMTPGVIVRTDTVRIDTRTEPVRTDVRTDTTAPHTHMGQDPRYQTMPQMRRETMMMMDMRPNHDQVYDRLYDLMGPNFRGTFASTWPRMTWREQDALVNMVRESYNPQAWLWMPGDRRY